MFKKKTKWVMCSVGDDCRYKKRRNCLHGEPHTSMMCCMSTCKWRDGVDNLLGGDCREVVNINNEWWMKTYLVNTTRLWSNMKKGVK